MSSSECPWKVKSFQSHSKHITKEKAGGEQKQTAENKEMKNETKENKQNKSLKIKEIKMDSFNYQTTVSKWSNLQPKRFIAPKKPHPEPQEIMLSGANQALWYGNDYNTSQIPLHSPKLRDGLIAGFPKRKTLQQVCKPSPQF